MRLMSAGIEVQKSVAGLSGLLETIRDDQKSTRNSAESPLTCNGLNDNRQLFVRPLIFNETLITDFKTPRAPGISTAASTWDCDGDRNRTAIIN